MSIRCARRRARRRIRRPMYSVLVAAVAGILFAGVGWPRLSYAEEMLRARSLPGMPRAQGGMSSFNDSLLPPGVPSADMRFATGSLPLIMKFVFSGLGSGSFLGTMTEPETQARGPFSTAQGGSPVSIGAEENSGGLGLSTPAHGSPSPLAKPHGRLGIRVACSDEQTENQLQAGGRFWTPQARSGAPVQFPGAVFIGSRLASKDPLGLGPIGHPVNVPAAGPAGSWCRPPPTPMGQSSPLEYRVFWITLLFPLAVFLVFFASRGFGIRAHD